MRRLLILAATVGVLGVLGWQVREKEAILKDGQIVLMELAPVDPRSLMQGDYMRLRWAMTRGIIAEGSGQPVAIVALDERRVASFRRLADGGALAPGEIRFRLAHDAYSGVEIAPTSFLFEEGRATDYARARFGIFRVSADGEHLLVGLADDKAQPIAP